MNPIDEKLLKNSKKILDESAESLDAATLSRLNQARQKALGSHTAAFSFKTSWIPASAFASLGIAVTTAWLLTSLPDDTEQFQIAKVYEDMEMLTSETDLELLEQLEFVSWLVEEEQNNAG